VEEHKEVEFGWSWGGRRRAGYGVLLRAAAIGLGHGGDVPAC
jgi:hypothetical protein